MRGNLDNDKDKLLIFAESMANFREFRSILDSLPDKEAQLARIKDLSDDLWATEFYDSDITDMETAEDIRGMA